MGHVAGGYLESSYFRPQIRDDISLYKSAMPQLTISEAAELREVKGRLKDMESLREEVDILKGMLASYIDQSNRS